MHHPLESHMLDCGVPAHMHDGIQLWIDHGIEPGSFLMAVICNDLKGAIGKADHINKSRIANFVQFFYSHAPSSCWGSEEKATEWANHGGLSEINGDMDMDATESDHNLEVSLERGNAEVQS